MTYGHYTEEIDLNVKKMTATRDDEGPLNGFVEEHPLTKGNIWEGKVGDMNRRHTYM